MDRLVSEIENYISYFGEQLEHIKQIDQSLISKILIVAMIDTLSRAVYPETKSVKVRYIDFICKLSCWADSERVSLYLLRRKLKEYPLLITNPLYSHIRLTLNNLMKYKIYSIDEIDPFQSTLLEKAICSDEERLIHECTHVELFYKYRNYLVHEFRSPGYTFETNNVKPHYWRDQLAYPKEFMIILTENLIQSLKSYLVQNGINPYDSYDFSVDWSRRV